MARKNLEKSRISKLSKLGFSQFRRGGLENKVTTKREDVDVEATGMKFELSQRRIRDVQIVTCALNQTDGNK